MTSTVRVTGLKELEQSLSQLQGKVAKKSLEIAVKSGTKVVLDEAKRRAPVGNTTHKFKERGQVITVRPGNLRRSLKQRVYRGQRAAMGSIQAIIPLDGRAFYGKFQEWGFKSRSGKYIAPKRFLGPAWEAKKGEALDQVGKRLGEEVEKAARESANAR
jgi:HK97 gp10 family phage protein